MPACNNSYECRRTLLRSLKRHACSTERRVLVFVCSDRRAARRLDPVCPDRGGGAHRITRDAVPPPFFALERRTEYDRPQHISFCPRGFTAVNVLFQCLLRLVRDISFFTCSYPRPPLSLRTCSFRSFALSMASSPMKATISSRSGRCNHTSTPFNDHRGGDKLRRLFTAGGKSS